MLLSRLYKVPVCVRVPEYKHAQTERVFLMRGVVLLELCMHFVNQKKSFYLHHFQHVSQIPMQIFD